MKDSMMVIALELMPSSCRAAASRWPSPPTRAREYASQRRPLSEPASALRTRLHGQKQMKFVLGGVGTLSSCSYRTLRRAPFQIPRTQPQIWAHRVDLLQNLVDVDPPAILPPAVWPSKLLGHIPLSNADPAEQQGMQHVMPAAHGARRAVQCWQALLHLWQCYVSGRRSIHGNQLC